MSKPAITDAEIQLMTRQVDSLIITANDIPEMYTKLNRLERCGSKNWQLLRAPVWRDGRLIAVVLKPDPDVVKPPPPEPDPIRNRMLDTRSRYIATRGHEPNVVTVTPQLWKAIATSCCGDPNLPPTGTFLGCRIELNETSFYFSYEVPK